MAISFALIAPGRDESGTLVIQELLQSGLRPDYVLVESREPQALAESAVYIDAGELPDVGRFEPKLGLDDIESGSVAGCCRTGQLPCLALAPGAWNQLYRILVAHPVDVLLTTERRLVGGPALYQPRRFVMSVMPVARRPVPWMSSDPAAGSDCETTIAAFVVTPWNDERSIIASRTFLCCAAASDRERHLLPERARLAVDALRQLEQPVQPVHQRPTSEARMGGRPPSDASRGVQPAPALSVSSTANIHEL